MPARSWRVSAPTSSRCACREELDGLDGLVVPGGESTTIMRLARLYDLDDGIRLVPRAAAARHVRQGMIVLDRAHLGLVDVEVDRNAYGRQVASFEAELELDGDDRTAARRVHPRSARARTSVTRSRCWARSTASRCSSATGRYLLASFHPELTADTRVHELFLEMVTAARPVT